MTGTIADNGSYKWASSVGVDGTAPWAYIPAGYYHDNPWIYMSKDQVKSMADSAGVGYNAGYSDGSLKHLNRNRSEVNGTNSWTNILTFTAPRFVSIYYTDRNNHGYWYSYGRVYVNGNLVFNGENSTEPGHDFNGHYGNLSNANVTIQYKTENGGGGCSVGWDIWYC